MLVWYYFQTRNSAAVSSATAAGTQMTGVAKNYCIIPSATNAFVSTFPNLVVYIFLTFLPFTSLILIYTFSIVHFISSKNNFASNIGYPSTWVVPVILCLLIVRSLQQLQPWRTHCPNLSPWLVAGTLLRQTFLWGILLSLEGVDLALRRKNQFIHSYSTSSSFS